MFLVDITPSLTLSFTYSFGTLIHSVFFRCSSSRSGKIYLHTDIRLIFARHKLDIDAKTVPYEMKSYTDVPRNPKYSPKK